MITFKEYLEINSNVPKNILGESPQLVSGIKWKQKENKEWVDSLRSNGTKIGVYNGIELIHARKGHDDFYMGFLLDKLVYVVEVYMNPANRMRIQTKLWRDKTESKSQGLPIHVVLKYIINRSGNVFSDIEQTIDGKKFWIRLIKEASKNPKLHIGVIDDTTQYTAWDRREDINKWIKKVESVVWGSTPKFKSCVAFITDKPIN